MTVTLNQASGPRLMHVHAHPDDESSKGAASTARYVNEGVEVRVVTCTGGEQGSVLNPALDEPYIRAHLGDIRRAEMDAARDVLGVSQRWLGFLDSGWPEGEPPPALPTEAFALQPMAGPVEALVREIRAFRPQVLTTYAEQGDYPHPDHVMSARVARAAFVAAGDPARFPNAGVPWAPSKLYQHRPFDPQRLQALSDAARQAGLREPYPAWLRQWLPPAEPARRVPTRVECADWFDVRNKALCAHATQVEPDGPWLALPIELEAEVWSTEDFDLVHTTIAVPDIETDLFAGL